MKEKLNLNVLHVDEGVRLKFSGSLAIGEINMNL